MSKFWFDFSILALVLSIYYLAKQTTGNLLNNVDRTVCGIVIVFCIGNIVLYAYKVWKKRKK